MKNHLFFTLFLISLVCLSQEKIPYIDIEEITNLAINTSGENDYEKTLELFDKISKNDSSYCSVLISKSYYLLQLKKYDEAIKIADVGLKNDCLDSNLSFYINIGNAYINQKKYVEAVKVYDVGLETYPKNYQLWYNKGVALEYQGKLNEAVVAYQNTILLNPTYKKPHLQLGNICYKQARISQALMCFNMYLLLEPDAEGAFGTLKSLNNIVEIKNVNEPNPDIQISKDDDYFEDIDLIISNKIALNEKYETGNKINISLTRQNHALLEQLKEFEGDGGFWDTKYVPFFKWIKENNHFDNFTYTLSYSIKNEKYMKIIENKEKEINSFIESFIEKWKSILQTNNIEFEGKNQEITYNYYNSYVDAIGKKDNNIAIGNWNFYNSLGQLTAIGKYNEKGNRHEKWVWYNKKGKIKEVAMYEDGKLNGEYFEYHQYEKPYVVSKYVNDNLDGEYKYYNDKGALVQKKFYKNGVLDGLYQSYFAVGEELIEFHIPYKNDLVDKKVIEYYANGNIYSEVQFLDGKRNGLEKIYHYNKNLSSEINYREEELNGSYKTFYSNNSPLEVGQSLDGSYHGAWKTYYKNGILQSEFSYDKGKLNGLYKYYDTDGKVHYEYLYRKGEIINYKFYDKRGQTIKEESKKGGEFYYTGYSPDGNIISEGIYDISGGKKGEWRFYSSNGILTGKGKYIDDKIDGEYISYYNSEKKQSVSFYKNDSLTGYYVDYHKNGKINSQGWYKDNLLHGEWRSYYIDGTLKIINFYHKSQLHGNQEYYTCNGKLDMIYKYRYNELISETDFDIEKKEFNHINYQRADNEFKTTYKHFNNIISTELSYVNGIRHGNYNYYDYYGKIKVTGNYTNDEQDGEWIWYYDRSDKIESKYIYLNGSINGEVLNYFEDGSIMSNSYYEYGKTSGTWISYNDNGSKSITTEYDNDNLHGRKEFYSYSGKLQLVRFYNQGRLIGYSYLDKDANELPMIPLKNETGKIKAYFDNGNISREMEYKNGDLINNYKAYYYSGQLETEITYEDAEYNGLLIEYYSNGSIKNHKEYLYGALHGMSKSYHDSSKIKEETNYINNVKSGASNYYNSQGKLIKKELYFNGDIYSSEIY